MIIEINKITAHPFHQKIYQTNDIDDLKESIQDVGLLERIKTNKKFQIISGHRRLLALKELGYKKVEVDVIDVSLGDEPKTLITFNKQRIKSKRELLNEAKFLKSIWSQKRGPKSMSDKDFPVLAPVNTRAKIADELDISTGNLSKLEYIDKHKPTYIDDIDKDILSINQAFRNLKINEKYIKDRDFTAKLPKVITNDNYNIINKSSDDLSDLKDESVQMIFTSPPYWQKRTYSNDSNELGAEKTSEEYVQRISKHIHESHRVLKKDGSLFLNLSDSFMDKSLHLIPNRVVIELRNKGWLVRNSIIWKKSNNMPFTTKDNLTSSYEFIFHLVKSKDYYYDEVLTPCKNKKRLETAKIITRKSGRKCIEDNARVVLPSLKDGKKLEDFWTPDIVTTAAANQAEVRKYGGTDHPAPFPKELPFLPILQTTKPGDTVLDLFSGSGTTSTAALLLGRKTIAYELNPIHNQVQINRFEDAIRTYNRNNPQANIAA